MLVFDEGYGRKNPQSRVENQQTQSTYDAECRNRTLTTLLHKSHVANSKFVDRAKQQVLNPTTGQHNLCCLVRYSNTELFKRYALVLPQPLLFIRWQVLRVDISIITTDRSIIDTALHVCFSPSSLKQLLVVTSSARLLKLHSENGVLLSEVCCEFVACFLFKKVSLQMSGRFKWTRWLHTVCEQVDNCHVTQRKRYFKGFLISRTSPLIQS